MRKNLTDLYNEYTLRHNRKPKIQWVAQKT